MTVARQLPTRSARCSRGSSCVRYDSASALARVAVVELDGAALCGADAFIQNVYPWGVAARQGITFRSAPADLATYTSGSWAQASFSNASTYDVLVSAAFTGVTIYASLRETGANLRTTAVRQGIVAALQEALRAIATAEQRTGTMGTVTFRRRVVT